MFSQRLGVCTVGLLALLVACSDGGTESGDTAPLATSEATIVTSPETAVVDTAVDSTSLDLREGGLGGFDFGAQPDAVIDAVSARLGEPTSDNTRDYPSSDGNGLFITDTFSFIEPSGRSVCWSVGLCVSFGGRDAANQLFTGWSYFDDATSELSTAYGVTIGTRLKDDDRIILNYLQPCDNGIDGLEGLSFLDENDPVIRLRVLSEGTPFTRSGNLPGPYAAPEDLVIVGLSAGHNPNLIASECGDDRSAR